MKVSINWVKQIVERDQCSADPTKIGIDKLIDKIGAQLGAVEEVIDVGKKYKGIVVAKVVSCEKHPNADKLSICLIDDGKKIKRVKRDTKGLVEVVCGAPNVAAGQLIVWLPPGVTVPATAHKEPLVLEARKIRGVVSNGMIASAKELDLGDDHSGILVLEGNFKPGDDFAKAFGLDDYVIDIENKMFTHRPDCFGLLGIARELAGIQGNVFRSPRWYLNEPKRVNHNGDARLLEVKNEAPKIVPRYMMQVIKNVNVTPSTAITQSQLMRVGVRPINNIVDITNWLMLETAQPIHAFDYDKVKALSGGDQAKIIVRQAKTGEKFLALGGKQLSLQGGEIVIATDQEVIGLAGVIGGATTEVDTNTKNIILEVANFDMNTIRQTAMTHGLFTDAATRFTKNQSPWQTDRVLARAVELIKQISGGLPARHIYDLKGKLARPSVVTVQTDFINQRLGLKLSTAEIKKILENVEFQVKLSGGKLSVGVPFWRTDIEIAEDIVEEVGRLYGYDHLPLELPKRGLHPAANNPTIDLKAKIREALAAAGANEVLTYSFVHGSLLEKVGQDTKRAFRLKNALSPDLQYYRLSLGPSLLEKVHPNIKQGFDEFVLFELGQAHTKDKLGSDKLPQPLQRLAVVYASKDGQSGSPYFIAEKFCDYLLDRLGVQNVVYELTKDPALHKTATYYEPARSANILINGSLAGRIGEIKAEVKANLKLPPATAAFELHVDEVLAAASPIDYQPLGRFPSLTQDICLRVMAGRSYAEVYELVQSTLSKAEKQSGYLTEIEPVDIFQRSNDKNHKQITLRIFIEHPERTLTTAEANKLLDIIAAEAKKQLKADRV